MLLKFFATSICNFTMVMLILTEFTTRVWLFITCQSIQEITIATYGCKANFSKQTVIISVMYAFVQLLGLIM